MKKIIYSIFFLNLFSDNFCKITKPKIVGLMQVRNEEPIIYQHLKALSLYTDAIVIVDDASIDATPLIIKSFQQDFNIKRFIQRTIATRDSGNESDNATLLLRLGREIGGTHFIVIDADEMFTANCLENNFLRNEILSLKPGEKISMWWIQLWRNIYCYRSDPESVWTHNFGTFIFCDDQQAYYPKKFLHSARTPITKNSTTKKISTKYGLMHFQFVNWKNLLLKQAWYRCLEKICGTHTTYEINTMYGHSKNETGLQTTQAPQEWLAYDFFDPSVYEKPSFWRLNQIQEWFAMYGAEFFENIDIWDVSEIKKLIS